MVLYVRFLKHLGLVNMFAIIKGFSVCSSIQEPVCCLQSYEISFFVMHIVVFTHSITRKRVLMCSAVFCCMFT